jgi:hypothetical protein
VDFEDREGCWDWDEILRQALNLEEGRVQDGDIFCYVDVMFHCAGNTCLATPPETPQPWEHASG